MLVVTFNLATVWAMLFSMAGLGNMIEVDGLNSPTAKPILGGPMEVCCQ
jgi:hypothetical protein